MKKIRAFTLIELMMVMVIIGILASLITTGAFKSIESARESRAESDIVALEAALERYKLDVGRYPYNTTADTNLFVEWLQNDTSPSTAGWDGPYMSFKPKDVGGSGDDYLDPWGNAYSYICWYDSDIAWLRDRGYKHIYLGGATTTNNFDLWSFGADGLNDCKTPNFVNTNDDITNWD